MTDEKNTVTASEKLDVSVDQDERTVASVSTAELLHIAWQRAEREQTRLEADAAGGDARREFALAKTHIEDAINRYNKGVYRVAGTYAVTDAERTREKSDGG